MERYKILKATSVMGMGDVVYSIFSQRDAHIAYINEKAQILFTKPVNLNIAKDVLDLAMELEEGKSALSSTGT